MKFPEKLKNDLEGEAAQKKEILPQGRLDEILESLTGQDPDKQLGPEKIEELSLEAIEIGRALDDTAPLYSFIGRINLATCKRGFKMNDFQKRKIEGIIRSFGDRADEIYKLKNNLIKK